MKYWSMTLAMVAAAAALLSAAVPGTSMKKMVGDYDYKSAAFDATIVLAENRVISRLGDTASSHAVAGKWWYKGRKDMIVARFPDAALTGIIVNVNLITGTYRRVERAAEAFVMTRTNVPIFHLKMNLCKPKRAHGGVIYNWNKTITLSGFNVAVYSRLAGTGRLEQTPYKFTKIGFFARRLTKPYDTAEAYLVSSAFVPPATLPAPLPVDNINVFAADSATNGFRFFDWSSTNDPNFF